VSTFTFDLEISGSRVRNQFRNEYAKIVFTKKFHSTTGAENILLRFSGGMHLPHADSARIIVGAWWLVVLVVATTYCGNLVAFLTFPKIDIPITTIDELLDHSDTVTWSMTKNSFLETSLKVLFELSKGDK
jgi:hypothetical protein